MNHAVEGLRLQKPMKLSTESRILCIQIIGWQSEWSGKSWIWYTTVHQILTNALGMRKICTKIAPKHLSQDQKVIRRERCLDFLESIENDPHFLERVITGDESWVFQYDSETKCWSMEWHASVSLRPAPPKKKQEWGVEDQMIGGLVFSIATEWSSKSLCLKAKWSINTYQEDLENLWKSVMCVWDQTSRTPGCCIMTMHLVTQQFNKLVFGQ